MKDPDNPNSFFTQARRNTHLFLLLLIVMVTAFGAWAAVGELEVVSRATGEVVPFSRLKTVQHLEGGIIREILVAEGNTVEVGQPLIVLEPTISSADVAEHTIQLNSLQAKVIRLNAEISGPTPPRFSDQLKLEAPDLVRRETDIFHNRQHRLKQQGAVQEALVRQYQFQIEEISARIAGTSDVLQFIEEQVSISEKLLHHNLSNRMNHVDLLKQLADLKAQQQVDRASLKRIQEAIQEARSRLELVKTTFLEEAHDDLRDAQRSYDIIRERILKDQDSLLRTVLRSPVDGIVKSLFVFTVGGILRPGGSVAEIVPGEDHLVIEARLPVGDIGYVQTDQPVLLRLASSESARLGAIDGIVTHVSPDSFYPDEGPPFFRIQIQAQQDYFGTSEQPYRLSPGLVIQCSIITGRRTILTYLLDPFRLALETGLRER